MTKKITIQDIADTIDHSLLRPDITVDELVAGCRLAVENKCISVCVRPSDLPVVVKELKGSAVLPTTVISFPHGTCTTETKVFESIDAIEKGAVEVDMVMNIGRFLSGDHDFVEQEILTVTKEVHKRNAIIKIIFENFYLNDDQIIKCCEMCKRCGVDFIKTSTGYAGGGATLHDLALMTDHAAGMKVKAAGGVKTLEQALDILALGVARIGTRSTEKILEEAQVLFEQDKLLLPEK